MSSIRPISGLEAFDSGVNISKNQIWVAVPGTIRSFDPDTVTCVVDMAIISGINTSKEDNISALTGSIEIVRITPFSWMRR